MRFGAPEYFWALFALPVLAGFFLWSFHKKRQALARFAHVEMLRRMAANISRARQIAKSLLLLGAVALCILALTRPQFGTRMELIKRRGLDVVIAVDVSVSMFAEDIKPNRLARSKKEISEFMARLAGDRVALVPFAGEAFIQCPLTLDYGAANIFLDILGPDLIPVPGTAIGSALEKALEAFDGKGRKYKVVVLLTDGEDHSGKAEQMAEKAAEEGVVVYTVGIGSLQGVPIPIKDGQGRVTYKKDRAGNVVTTQLDEVLLQRIALTTGGKYFHAAPGGFELKAVLEDINEMEKRELESEQFTQYQERFQYPLAAALILLVGEMLISDRRRRKGPWEGRFS